MAKHSVVRENVAAPD